MEQESKIELLLRDAHGRFYPCEISWTGFDFYFGGGSNQRNYRFTNHQYQNGTIYYDNGINAVEIMDAIHKKLKPPSFVISPSTIATGSTVTVSGVYENGQIVWTR